MAKKPHYYVAMITFGVAVVAAVAAMNDVINIQPRRYNVQPFNHHNSMFCLSGSQISPYLSISFFIFNRS